MREKELADALAEARQKQKEPEQGCLPILGLFVLVPINTLIRGFVLFKYWNWFVLPIGGPDISFWHVLGLTSGLAYIAWQKPQDDGKVSWTDVWEHFIFTAVMAALFLLFGWAYVSWM